MLLLVLLLNGAQMVVIFYRVSVIVRVRFSVSVGVSVSVRVRVRVMFWI